MTVKAYLNLTLVPNPNYSKCDDIAHSLSDEEERDGGTEGWRNGGEGEGETKGVVVWKSVGDSYI